MKLKIYKITVILISLVLLTIFFLNLNYAKNNTNIVNDYISYFMPWIIIFFIVVIYILIFIKKVKYYDFGLIFIILSNFFMFGTIFLKWLNLESDIWDPVYFYSSNEMFQAISYVIPAIFLFTIGYALFGNRKITRDNIDNNSKYDDQLVYYTGIFMSIFGGIFRIICDVPTIIYMMGANTYVAYSDYAVSGFLYTFAGLFVPGVIFLMYSKKMSKFKNIIMVIVISYIVITMILTGSRKQEIFDIVTLVLCYLANLKKKISLKKVLLLFILGYLFLDLIYVIREYRTTLDLIPMKYIESIFSFNAIPILFAETLSEVGMVIYSVTNIVKYVPAIMGYEYGMTFLRTIFSFLPINPLVGDFFYKASSTNVINEYLNLPVGSSMFGDMYWNFGYLGGLMFSFIIGFLFYLFFNRYLKKFTDNYSAAIYFCCFDILIVLVRAEFFDCWRTLVYFFVTVFLIKYILIKKKTRREKLSN